MWPSEAKALCRLAYWPAMDSARYLYSPNNTAIRSLGNLAASSGDRWSRVEITREVWTHISPSGLGVDEAAPARAARAN